MDYEKLVVGRPFARIPLQFKTIGSGCFEVTSHKLNQKGYPHIWLHGHNVKTHRMIWEECFGPIPAGMCVCHRCDNPACINPEHLFLGTIVDNNHDMVRKGRQVRGEANGTSKLTEEDIRQIRSRYRPKGGCDSGRAMAREFGVTQRAIWEVTSGKSWRHTG